MRTIYLLSFLSTLLLISCSSRYQAPIDDLDETPRFVDSGRTHLVNGGETLYVIAWMYDLDFAALARANNLREPYLVTPGQILNVDLRDQPAIRITTAPVAVTTTAVQTARAIQRTPLPSGAITARRELPAAGSQATGNPRATVPADDNISDNREISVQPVHQSPTLPTTRAASSSTSTNNTVVAIVPPVVTTLPESTITDNHEVNWNWPFKGNIIGRFSASGVENKGLDMAGNKGDPVLAAAPGEVVYSGSGLLRYGDLIIIKHNDHFLSAYAHNSVLNVKEGDKVSLGQKIAELGSSGIDHNMLHFEIRLDGKPVDPLQYLPVR